MRMLMIMLNYLLVYLLSFFIPVVSYKFQWEITPAVEHANVSFWTSVESMHARCISRHVFCAFYTNENKKAMLREHKPPPIRRIRISEFGLPDPKRDPDRHQNCITWSLSHALPLQKISSKAVHKFASNPTDRQTNRQTDRQTNRQTDRTKNITSFFSGGN